MNVKINGQDVYGVYVRKSPQAAFLKSEKGIEFYIRSGNSTRSLNIQEFHDYFTNQTKNLALTIKRDWLQCDRDSF